MIFGRQKEIEILKQAAKDEKLHFVAVYGQRRIGKTFLVRETFSYRFAFQHVGIYQGTLKEQLLEWWIMLIQRICRVL